MRELVYYIAATLDGFIAREDGSFSDFPWDDEFGAYLLETYPETFPAHLRPGEPTRSHNRRFDAVLMGRKTYDVGLREGVTSPYPTLDQYVVSRSLEPPPDSGVTILQDDVEEHVRALKRADGRDIWLCGGGEVASLLMRRELIDRVVVKLNPVLFGRGIPMLSQEIRGTSLGLTATRQFRSGHMVLEYQVV